MYYIILINWNGSNDTIECLESICKITTNNIRVIICDNGSEDDSLSQFSIWSPVKSSSKIKSHLPKNPENDYSHERLLEFITFSDFEDGRSVGRLFTVVTIPTNIGFAAANNVGIRLSLRDAHLRGIVLLNNDTVVQPDFLDALIRRCDADKRIGMCGATVLFYEEPEIIQCAGGARYNPWTGKHYHLAIKHCRRNQPDQDEIEAQLSYISGACMYVTPEFIRSIGLMNEIYFLYYEELDWAARSKGRFKLGYAKDAIVYHKVGRSIGSSHNGRPSDKSIYYLSLSLLLYTMKFHSGKMPFILFALVARSCRYLIRWDARSAGVVLIALQHWIEKVYRRSGRPDRPKQ